MTAGDIVLVQFPFRDLESSKKRPVLVLGHHEVTSRVAVVTVAMITSRTEGPKFPGDCLIKEWEASGLLHPSTIRLAKIASLDVALVGKPLGKLAKSDLASALKVFRKHFKAWLS